MLVAGIVLFVWHTPGKRSPLAPDIAMPTLTGQELHLKSYRGRPVLLNFWATTCPGCLCELPHLIALHDRYSPRGLQVIGVSMSYVPPNEVLAFAENKAIPYPIALDPIGAVAKAFGDVRVTPTSFLIGPDGRILEHRIGELDLDSTRRRIENLL